MTDRHADSFNKVEPVETATPAPAPQQQQKPVDNAEQAARVEAQREYTMGGDDDPDKTKRLPVERPKLDAAIARIKSTDRPSPFGVAGFPPLPKPPGTR